MDIGFKQFRRGLWGLLSLWSAAILVLFFGDLGYLSHTIKEIAVIEARAYLNKDQAIRRWAASNGGVYVPVSARTPPNPFLAKVPDRDVRTPAGRTLTLLNPAYMIRQIMQDFDQQYNVRGHITSLHYYRPETAPDAWESAALAAFENGRQEVLEFSDLRGETHLRLMRPLITETQCLKCHAAQGYKVGDIRGGVSVSVPMHPYWVYRRREMVTHGISLGLLWLLGCAGIWLAGGKMTDSRKKRDEAVALLQIAEKNNRALIDNAMTGIYIRQDGRIRFCNSKFSGIHGYSPDELVGMDAAQLVHPLDRPFAADLHHKRMQGQAVPEVYEIRCVTGDGRTIWVQRRNTIIVHDGRPAVLGNEIDITEKKESQERLQKSEALLKHTVAELVQNQEVERKAIAFEIHEQIAQSLSAVKMGIEASLSADSPWPAPHVARPIIDQIRVTIDLIRRLTRRLNPSMLDDLGLKGTVSALCRKVMANCPQSQITAHTDIDERLIPGELKIFIYRVLDDALNLSVRYHRAHHWTVAIKAGDDRIALNIEVSGTDSALAAEKSGWEQGLATLNNRIESFGGSLIVNSREANRCILEATWPLPGETEK